MNIEEAKDNNMIPGMMYITDINNMQNQKIIGFVVDNQTKKYPLTCIDFTSDKISIVNYSYIQVKPLEISIKDYIVEKNLIVKTLKFLKIPNTINKSTLKQLQELYDYLIVEYNKRLSQHESDENNKSNKKNKKYFFGWTNIKRLIVEIIKIWSSKKSIFSKKRIESSVAFLIGQFGMVYYLMENINTMLISDFLIWASIEFVIAGWTVFQIEKSKKSQTSNDNTHLNEDEYTDSSIIN